MLGASLFGLASLFPSQYVQATMTGQAMGGVFAAVANLVTLAIGSNVINSGLAFFIFATFMAVLTLIGYGCLYGIVSKITLFYNNTSRVPLASESQGLF